ncbi:MAG TPA: tetratricopeptide repeat protein, partial [Thermoanaerobaculia bacterium]|nr:tetratricopeptide repeat protein [Thermoanaerobaculia bacterium]
ISFVLLSLLAANASCDRTAQLILRGQYNAALEQLEGTKSSSTEPDNLRGLAYLLAGDAKRALASFDRALAQKPAFAEARFNRAVALLRLGEMSRASTELERVYADEHSPLRATAAYHNALALDGLKRYDEAATWLDRALALDASLDAALLYSGVLKEKRGDLQGAGRVYLAYLEKNPNDVAAMLRFGVCAQRSGHADTAVKYLKRVVELAPESPEGVEARKFLVMWE